MAGRFFLPLATTAKEQEAVYEALRKTAAAHLSPGLVSARRLRAVCVLTEGQEQWVEVGKRWTVLRELVMAIFQAEGKGGPFLVLTPTHGVWSGQPHEVPAERVLGIREFGG